MKIDLKSKKVLFVGWGCENPQDSYMYQVYYLIFNKIFPKLTTFDSKKNYFQYGRDNMNKQFLNLLSRQEFDFIIYAMDEEEFYLETILKARELQPIARTMFIISDDDTRFSHYSRYFSLLFDHTVTTQDFVSAYNKDGIKNVSIHYDYNTYKLEPLKIKKIYDVTFIGRPKADRYEIIKYLLENKINITLFGWDWYKYPDLKDIYKGPLNPEDYNKVINQSKINLCLTKSGYSEETGVYNLKARLFEDAFCNSFQIVEYVERVLKFFKPDKEVVLFKSKEELLEKINYYLKHDKERDKIAENAYKKIIKKFDQVENLTKIIRKVFSEKRREIKIPETKAKIITLENKDLKSSDLKEKLKDMDYVFFSKGKHKNSIYKNNLQVYSIEKTGKPISCCDYYVSSRVIGGDYLRLRSHFAFKRLGKEANKLINPNQLMIKKDYFLNNLESFKKLFSNEGFNMIDSDNTAFVSFPLTRITELKKIEYEKMLKAFDMTFIKILFSLVYQKKIMTNRYPYFLTLKSVLGNTFILRHILRSLKDTHNRDKLNLNKDYIKDSPIKKLVQ